MQSTAISAERNISFKIEHECPQCGAPATLEETERLFRCGFCRVSSYLTTADYFRYILPDNAPDDADLIYFPYWRFKGMIFSCLPDGIKDKFIDFSKPAIGSRFFPSSIGFRGQTQALKFINPELKGRFLKPLNSFKKIMTRFTGNLQRNLPGQLLFQTHIGETKSLIYAPFYIEGSLMDALLNEPVTSSSPGDIPISSFQDEPPAPGIRFIPSLCPSCGWDLQGTSDCLVLHCRNCASLWQPAGNKLQRLNAVCFLSKDPKTVYVPFWRIKADVYGIFLKSYADLIRVANLPKVIQEQWENQQFHFWCPALKLRPRQFLQIATHTTLVQLSGDLEKLPGKKRVLAANLAASEASKIGKIILGQIIRPKERVVELMDQLQVIPQKYLLVYLPFNESDHEYIGQDTGIAINKNMLKLSGNL